jgi:hypothetical protein
MNPRDLLRVARGATMVMDQMIAQNRGDVAARMTSAGHHANEFVKVLIEIAKEKMQDHPADPAAARQPTQSEAAPPADLIGFSAIRGEELKVKIDPQS